eukprot:CAMPEP_0204564176 /NCGR_PEP_ID=MMETSP0661-20131031/34736_1 /ASSEMBLY_ACC=CAM_ASM_000606 /TAXON_ID=109239 /ORGANISM="Alexandrium margalefi, Strain AMGDE01CS-322" /LENGTH=187 /DNA_ID=CAMNT_0051571801 /DNA_START=74 /DNA_END=636 /DNA_ORIENTATION=-
MRGWPCATAEERDLQPPRAGREPPLHESDAAHYSTAVSDCEKAGQWQSAVRRMREGSCRATARLTSLLATRLSTRAGLQVSGVAAGYVFSSTTRLPALARRVASGRAPSRPSPSPQCGRLHVREGWPVAVRLVPFCNAAAEPLCVRRHNLQLAARNGDKVRLLRSGSALFAAMTWFRLMCSHTPRQS